MIKINIGQFIINKKNTILLLHKDEEEWFELPGSCIRQSTNIIKPLKKSVKKILNIDIKKFKYIGRKEVNENNLILCYHWFHALYKNNKKLRLIQKKYDYYKFIEIDKLNQFKISPNVQILLNNFEIIFKDKLLYFYKKSKFNNKCVFNELSEFLFV
jgi:hypothetical protein